MELKKYQKRVITDLHEYLSYLRITGSLSSAYEQYWLSKGVEVGDQGMPAYQNIIDGSPHVCYKVPTGGGKTMLACASIKPIMEATTSASPRAVVWLVPSDAILTQTLQALKDVHHPYRQRIDADFSGRVEVYTKDELLAGQNFNLGSVTEQLSIMVLSYDSFRSNSKDGRKAYQANGNLSALSTAFGTPDRPIEGADETSLFQLINQMNPVVVVDESHHATSNLSVNMLKDFNPSFVLDLTATPKKQANIISFVDALTLKSENMVKLPVIAYNRSTQADVIVDAIDLRRSLEASAEKLRAQGGNYIRPIVLFQAQPKATEDATTFEALRKKLVDTGIPADQIAIKTAAIDELKNIDLMSEQCPIRFIITVNALKEGWDCPFAYVLASLANKTSTTDVQQILGRVLRLPYAQNVPDKLLNMSYVLTSSHDFKSTLENIVAGLNDAGFSRKDFRAVQDPEIVSTGTTDSPIPGTLPAPYQPTLYENDPALGGEDQNTGEEFLEFDEADVLGRLEERDAQPVQGDIQSEPVISDPALSGMLTRAIEENEGYTMAATEASNPAGNLLPADLRDVVTTYQMVNDFVEDAVKLRLPQLFVKAPQSALFSTGEGGWDLLEQSHLSDGFTLKNKDTSIDLSSSDEEMYNVDVRGSNADVPKAFRMNNSDQKILRQHMSKLSHEGRVNTAASIIYERLKPINHIQDADLKIYTRRIAENFDPTQLATFEQRPHAVAELVRKKILLLLQEHYSTRFAQQIDMGNIETRPAYQFPTAIQPVQASTLIGKSLYEGEKSMNNDEQDLATRLSALPNVRWWHKIIERKGFRINGPLAHYPDFVVMTSSGKIVLVEPKGAHLKNQDSQAKLELGRAWAQLSGHKYRYFMVFQPGVEPLHGAHSLSEFIEILEQL